MKYFLTLIALIFCLSSKAQDDGSFLIGKWKVVDVLMAKKPNPKMKMMIDMMKPSLLKSFILLKPNNKGQLNILPEMTPKEHKTPENMYWIYNAKSKRLDIYESKDKNNHLVKFDVHQQGVNTYFIINALTDIKSAIMLKVIKE